MTEFPGFDHLYELHDPLADRPFRGECGADLEPYLLSRGELTIDNPIHVSWAMGSAVPGDIVWATRAALIIASPCVVELLKAELVSGWTTYPVVVVGKNGEEFAGYSGFAITGRRGPRDLRQSSIELLQKPGGYYPEFRGHFFDPSSWDGSDVTVPIADESNRPTMIPVVSERVALLLRKAKIRNIRTVRLSEAIAPTLVYEIGSPHLLPQDFMDRVRAAYFQADIVPPPRYR